MVFRDDREATSERVDALERELAATKAELAALKGGGVEPNQRETQPFFGAPLRVELLREIDGALDAETRELIVEELRRRFGRAGTVSTIGRSLSWSLEPTRTRPSRVLDVSVRSRNGRTMIRATERNGQLAGDLFGGLGGGMGIGGGVGVVVGVAFALGAAWAVPALAVWLALTYLLARTIFVAVARSRRYELTAAVEAVVGLVREAAPAAARVADGRTFVRADAREAPGEPASHEELSLEPRARERRGAR